jgi:hypothetical protein
MCVCIYTHIYICGVLICAVHIKDFKWVLSQKSFIIDKLLILVKAIVLEEAFCKNRALKNERKSLKYDI